MANSTFSTCIFHQCAKWWERCLQLRNSRLEELITLQQCTDFLCYWLHLLLISFPLAREMHLETSTIPLMCWKCHWNAISWNVKNFVLVPISVIWDTFQIHILFFPKEIWKWYGCGYNTVHTLLTVFSGHIFEGFLVPFRPTKPVWPETRAGQRREREQWKMMHLFYHLWLSKKKS